MNCKNTLNRLGKPKICVVVLFLVLNVLPIHKVKAQDYPFKNLPNEIVATIDIDSSKKEIFINPLLGYNISGYTTSEQKNIIKKFDPITIRFPTGIFSNWYDWRIDDFTYYSPWIDETHKAVVNGQPKAGIAGLQSLNNDKTLSNGVGYDFLMTWNMSDDGAKGNDVNTNTESIERLKYYKSIGFDVNAIEFGNELFYRNQRSPFVPDEAGFLARAKKLSSDLKAIDNSVKISIPLIPRGSATNPNWNKLIAADRSYYDAVSVHKYIGVDVDNRLDVSNVGYEFGFTARLALKAAIDFARMYAQDKPVWLTEWGVDVGESPTGNAASCLGMADCYMYMSENQNIFNRSNWFSANGSANQLVKLVAGSFSTIEYPLRKTGYGLTHDIMRNAFENSTILSSKVTTATKLAINLGSVDAVSARAIVKDGKTTVLALNLTDKPAKFQIKINGSNYSDGYKLESRKFANMTELPLIPFDDQPFNFTQIGSGVVTLPPLSINVISNLAVTISGAKEPYSGLPINIPGTIEAEDYDKGGQNLSYYDSTPGNTGAAGTLGNIYRKDDVDIATTTNGGYAIAYIATGEWLEYTINIAEAGKYDFQIVYSSGKVGGGKIGFNLDGASLFTDFALPQTTTYNDFKPISKLGVDLPAGKHTLRINMVTDGFNLDKIVISKPVITGVSDDVKSQTFLVYPNPSKNGLFNLSKAYNWEVYNLTGAKIAHGKGDKVDMYAYPKGVYLLKIEQSVFKIISE
jgi:hypothetical protein